MDNKIVAIVGITGSGKTDAAEFFSRNGYYFLRFGQITLDEVKKRGLAPTEENERKIREGLRKEHGMDAYAKLNVPKIEEMLKKGNVVIDGLYSWAEFLFLKDKYKEKLITLAIYSPPMVRYERLAGRKTEKKDIDLKRRPATVEQARSRDFAEIENIQKAGPIVMADYTIVNDGTRKEYEEKLLEIIKKINLL